MSQYSFYEIIKANNIKVPIIQRDYVQGRDSHSAKKKIVDFIETISEHLINDEPLPLNFIYGYKDGLDFIPIDGQQRLTTLFLLYLYIFVKAGKEKETLSLKKFEYLVRPSSNRFFSALRDHLDCLNNSDFENEEPKSKTVTNVKSYEDDSNDITEFLNNCFIAKQNWFRKCWLNDLTVRSSIVVLYLIKENFKGINKYQDVYDRLTDPSKIIINFSYLEMNNPDSADETYVKMNARGKQLTPFENFKAELYSNYKSKTKPPCFDSFKKEIDSSWLAVALRLIIEDISINKASEESLECIDSVVFSLFNVLQTNNMVVKKLKKDNEAFISDSIFNMRLDDITLKEYFPDSEELNEIQQSLKVEGKSQPEIDAEINKKKKDYDFVLSKTIEDYYMLLSYLMVFLCNTERIKLINKYIGEIWGEDKKGNAQHYNERLIIFSIIKFLENVDNSVQYRDLYLLQWLKAFGYIIDHSEINTQEKFINAMDQIDHKIDFSYLNTGSFYENADKILSGFKQPFDEMQIEDEKRKANLRKNSSMWEFVLQKYEKNDVFKGQSIFLINKNKTINALDYYRYWKKTEEIFKNYSKDNNPLLCLFSAKGILIKLDGKKSYSCGYYDTDHYTYHWRGIFENQKYVDDYISVLDDFIKTKKNFKDYLNDLVNANNGKPIPDYQTNTEDFLKYVLSQDYRIYDYFRQGRYILNKTGNIKCVLLKNTSKNSDDTLDLSIAYLLFKYKDKGYEASTIDYKENEITMSKSGKEFKVNINDANSNYCLDNSSIYSDLNSVIAAIDVL